MVRDNQEPGLRTARHLIQHITEPRHIGIIQRCINLIQHTDRRRVGQEHSKNQRQCGQGLFATRQQAQRRKLLTRRLTHDLQAGFKRVVTFNQNEFRFATTKQMFEQDSKILIHLLKCRQQPLTTLFVQARNPTAQRRNC